MPGDAEVTIGFKTFLRPEKLRTCFEHISQLSPRPAEVIVADDSPRKDRNREVYAEFEDDLPLSVFDLEPDTGLAAGRNRILEQTDTEYLFVIDDDHYLPEAALDIKELLEVDPSLGGIAASWVEDGRLRMGAADIRVVDGWVIVDVFNEKSPVRTSSMSYYEYDFIPNSALFRTEALADYRWDDAYVIDGEHVDFYFGHKQMTDWRFAITPDVRIQHDPGPGSLGQYADHRMSDEKRRRSRAYFAEKWGVKGYLIREYHGTRYVGLLQELVARTFYHMPPVVHWRLKQEGHLDRMKDAAERVTGRRWSRLG